MPCHYNLYTVLFTRLLARSGRYEASKVIGVMQIQPFPLSPTAISCYLKSPKLFYWQYVRNIVPKELSADRYDHDKIFGNIWSEYVDGFYKKRADILELAVARWRVETEGWLATKERGSYEKSLLALANCYQNSYNPDDGMRSQGSELELKTNDWHVVLDGLGDGHVIHECKATSRAQSLKEQVWKYQNSIQARMYAVVTDAAGIVIELAFKDSPHQVFRAPIREFTTEEKLRWLNEFTDLRNEIFRPERDYVCNVEACGFTSKYRTSICPYRELCEGSDDITNYKQRKRREQCPPVSST